MCEGTLQHIRVPVPLLDHWQLATGQLKPGGYVSACPYANARVHAWASLTADISQAPEPTPAPARLCLFMKRRPSSASRQAQVPLRLCYGRGGVSARRAKTRRSDAQGAPPADSGRERKPQTPPRSLQSSSAKVPLTTNNSYTTMTPPQVTRPNSDLTH
ncbi:hypothetical protein LEMLEM_LOCUS20860 [Lemmus lemmus]